MFSYHIVCPAPLSTVYFTLFTDLLVGAFGVSKVVAYRWDILHFKCTIWYNIVNYKCWQFHILYFKML